MALSLRNRNITCIGLSLCILVGTLTIWGGMPISELTGLTIVDVVKYWTTALQFAMGLVLFSALLLKHEISTKHFRTLGAAAALFFTLGCIMLFFKSNHVIILVSGATIGASQGLLLLLWQKRLAELSESQIVIVPLVSLILSSAVYIVLTAFPASVMCPIAIAAVLISSYLVVLPQKEKNSQRAHSDHSPVPTTNDSVQASASITSLYEGASFRDVSFDAPFESATLYVLKNPLICLISMAVSVLLTRFVALGSVDNPDIVNISAHLCILVITTCLCIARFGFGLGNHSSSPQEITSIHHITIPAIATALLLLLLGSSFFAPFVAALSYAGFALLATTIMSTSISIARTHHARPEQVYGILLGGMYLTYSVITLLGSLWLFRLDATSETSIALVSVIILYAFSLALFCMYCVPERRKLKPEQPETLLQTDNIDSKMVELGKNANLTPREQDILALIIKGRDAPGIAAQLDISINTVRHHAKSVYRKLDVHSKQEILDLLEK